MVRWILLAVLVIPVCAAAPWILHKHNPPFATTTAPTDSPSSELAPEPDHESTTSPTGPFGKVELVGETEFDFGRMAFGETGSHRFAVKNVGEGELRLTAGSGSCACTVAEFEADGADNGKKELILKPGELTEITVNWKPRAARQFQNHALVRTNDPERAEVRFLISGDVYSSLVTVPAQAAFDFPNLPNDETTEASLALSSFDHPGLKILGIRSSRPDIISATCRELTPDENARNRFTRGYRIDITLKPSPALGSFRDELIVTTDHPRQAELRVPVRGRRVGAISVAPQQLRFSAAATKGGRATLALFVRNHEATHFEVAEKPQGLDVRIDEAAQPDAASTGTSSSATRSYRLTASVSPDTPPGKIAGTIVLKTDHPSAGVVTIPVSVAVRGVK